MRFKLLTIGMAVSTIALVSAQQKPATTTPSAAVSKITVYKSPT